MRVRRVALLAGTVIAALTLASTPALAHDGEDDGHEGETTTPTSFPEGIGINEGIFVSGAVVSLTPAGSGEPRTMDEYDAAVFVQSWLGAAFFSNPADAVKDPPAGLPIYRIDIAGTWNKEPGNVTAYYATDGTTPYIALPGLLVWNDPAQIPPPSQWFVPPLRVIDTFNGEGELIPTTGVEIATSVPTLPDEEAVSSPNGDASTSSPAPWVWAVGAGVLALGGGGAWLRRRRA